VEEEEVLVDKDGMHLPMWLPEGLPEELEQYLT
jgi:hypothetical protein